MLTELVPSGLRSFAPWRHRDELLEWQRSMNRMMRELFEEREPWLGAWQPELQGVAFAPRMDLTESEDKITLSAELPGLSEKDVEVSLDKEYLTIKGEKKEEKEVKASGRSFSERRYGSFERTLRLPATVDKEKVSAKFDRGILTIEVPKTPEARREVKKIPIKH